MDNSGGKLAVSSREAGCYSPQPLRFSSSLVSESRANRRLLLLPTAHSPARSAECEGAAQPAWAAAAPAGRHSRDAPAGAGQLQGSPPEVRVLFGNCILCTDCWIFHLLWRRTPYLSMYNLPTLPFSLLFECSQRAVLEEQLISKPKCCPGTGSSPARLARLHSNAWHGAGSTSQPSCPPLPPLQHLSGACH